MFSLTKLAAAWRQAFGPLHLQHDYNVANDTGSAVRADINNLAQAIATVNSGASAPGTTFAYQLWADTTSNTLKQRNGANTQWIRRGNLAESFVLSRSSNTILGEADFGKTIIATSTFTQTFTAAATLADGWWCEYRNDGTGVITLDPNSSEQIDSTTTLKLNPGESCIIWCNGSAFKTIGLGLVRGNYQIADNLTLTASVGSNALTIAIKNRNGDDPTAANPVRIPIRSATAGNGDFSELVITAATSLVVSSGSTLGTVSGQAHRLYVVGFNDAGTFRLGIYNPWDDTNKVLLALDEGIIYSATAEGGAGAADSPLVIYAGSAVTSKALRILGYVESTQAAAGTWATSPSRVQLMGPGVHKTGDIVQTVRSVTGAVATGTTAIPDDDTIPQSTEGDQYLTQAITPGFAGNLLDVSVGINLAHSADTTALGAALFQDATANALAGARISPGSTNRPDILSFSYRAIAATASSTTFKVRAGSATGATTTVNGASGARKWGGVLFSFLTVTEIFA